MSETNLGESPADFL